jgi:hypothetical protein
MYKFNPIPVPKQIPHTLGYGIQDSKLTNYPGFLAFGRFFYGKTATPPFLKMESKSRMSLPLCIDLKVIVNSVHNQIMFNFLTLIFTCFSIPSNI